MELPPLSLKMLQEGGLTLLLLYAVVALYRKVMEVQDLRVKDNTEHTKTITIALDAVVKNMESNNDTLKSIKISLEHTNGKQ